jgi:hypothetical protein
MSHAIKVKDLLGQSVGVVHNVLPGKNESIGPNFKLVAGATI